jgi:Na+/melibiose symporter-like transporter
MTSAHPLSVAARLFYGAGSIAFGVKDNGFSYFLLIFYSQVLGLPAARASTALFLAIIVDACADVAIGHYSDGLVTSCGRRHPLMFAAALPSALLYALLWNPPHWEAEQLFPYLLCTTVLVRLAISLNEIPQAALIAELTDDYDERTSLLSLRYLFGWGGGVAMAVLLQGVLLPGADSLDAGAYRSYGTVGAVVIFTSILASAAGTHHRIPFLPQPQPQQHNGGVCAAAREVRATLASSRSMLAVLGAALVFGMSGGLGSSLAMYLT